MRAIVCTKYGPPDVLRLQEVEKPAPGDSEVLIRIHGASLNAYDWHLLTADILPVRLMGGGLLRPKNRIPGADVAGRVEAVGKGVTRFQPGDDVFGDIGHGGFAEYACAAEARLAPKPANLSFEESAAVPMAALTALQALRDNGKIRPGHKVLVNGASGGVGTFAVQIAKFFGAEVTAVCSTLKMDTARSLGADFVIDYTKEDFTKSGRRYDLILAANGYHSILAYRRALVPGGIYVMAGGKPAQMFQSAILGPLVSLTGSRKMGMMVARIEPKDLTILKELLEAGKIRPVIDRRFTLDEVPDALRYLGEGHALGKIVISI
jgi:NADPH:quinone reductase-like Zn-dependent oxidoreductase